jgi:hypothetical protein
MNHNRTLAIAILISCICLSACSQAAATPAAPTPSPTSESLVSNFVDLIEQGTLTFQLTSGAINQLGLEMQNTSDSPVQAAIPAGTFFVNDDPQSQNMVVLHDASLSIPANGRAEVLLGVACANLHRSEPTRENTFTIQGEPEPYSLKDVVDSLNAAGVDYPVQQAAVWIVTDNATYDELGVLVKDSRFGAPVIDETDAVRAMQLVAETGLSVHRYAIWQELEQLSGKVSNPDLAAWLDIQRATQTVYDATQAVQVATQEAKVAARVAQIETQVALTATQSSLIETQRAPTETPTPTEELLPTVPFPTPLAGEISQFAVNASASSQYSDSSWSAMQAAGAPNTPECGDHGTAWASASTSGVDWLVLTYDQPVLPTRIVIFETYNPGAVTSVEVFAENGDPIKVYTGPSKKVSQCPRSLEIEIKDVNVPVKSVRVTLNHKVWSEIDAVQLVGLAP